MKRRNCTALLLAACLLLGLAACGEKAGEESGQKSGEPGSDPALLSDTVYTPERVDWSPDMSSLNSGCVSGDWLFLAGSAKGERGEEYALRRVPLEGGGAEPLPAYQPLAFPEEQWPPSPFIMGLRPGPEGTVWVREGYFLPSKSEYTNVLRQVDGEGKELACVRLPDKGAVDTPLVDGDGDIYIATEKGVDVLDPAGELRFSLEMEDESKRLVLLGDGRVGVSCEVRDAGGSQGVQLRTIDKSAKGWGESYSQSARYYVPTFDGRGADLFYYVDGDALQVWRDGAEAGETVLSWMNTGIDGSRLLCLAPLSGGRLLVMTRGEDVFSAQAAALYLLTPAQAGSLPEKKVLTYATMNLYSSERTAILNFNNTSPDYYIEVTDYSAYNTAGDRTAGMTRLATEISAGRVPDILNVGSLGIERWAARGLFEDLWPWIDGDPDISREDLMERVFQALETDGKLYQIASEFSMWTLTGAKSVVGDRMGWTAEEFRSALEAMPEGSIPLRDGTKTLVLRILMEMYADRFMDWERGECRFDSQAFRDVLAFCGSFPAQSEVDAQNINDETARLYGGQQMLCSWGVTNFKSIQRLKFLLQDEVSFVGWPNPWGDAGCAFLVSGSCAMSSACREKEGAWSFLRTLLLPRENVSPDGYSDFPTNRTDFQRMAELCMTAELGPDGQERSTSSELLGSIDGMDLTVDYYATTQAEYDQIMALYNATSQLSSWDESLLDIVTEEAGAYFAGDRTLEETAALVQSRAGIYMNEQK